MKKTKNVKTKGTKYLIKKPRFFKPVGFKPEFKTLFDEWKAFGRNGLPNQLLHPRKHKHFKEWNLLTNVLPASRDCIKGIPVQTFDSLFSGRGVIPRPIAYRAKDAKMTKKAKSMLEGQYGDCALFL